MTHPTPATQQAAGAAPADKNNAMKKHGYIESSIGGRAFKQGWDAALDSHGTDSGAAPASLSLRGANETCPKCGENGSHWCPLAAPDTVPAASVKKTDSERRKAVLDRLRDQEVGHNRNPFAPLLERLMANQGGYTITEIGQLKWALDGFYGAADRAARTQPVAAPLTDEQRQDLLAAAFFVAARNEPGAMLKDADAERIGELLVNLSGFDLARIGQERSTS